LIQHIGLIFGEEQGVVDGEQAFVSNYFRLTNPKINYGIASLLSAILRNITAVTAACLLIKRINFFAIHGFDTELKIACNDTDLCLRLFKKKGLLNIFVPYSVLNHSESISVGNLNSNNRNVHLYRKEIQKMKKRWGSALERDYFYNPNLTLVRALPAIKNI